MQACPRHMRNAAKAPGAILPWKYANFFRNSLCNPSFGPQVTTLSTDDGRGEHFEQQWAARQEGVDGDCKF